IAAAPAAARKISRARFGLAPGNPAHLPACSWRESAFQLPRTLGYRGNRASLLRPDGESADCARAVADADPNIGASSADLPFVSRRPVGMVAGRRDLEYATRSELFQCRRLRDLDFPCPADARRPCPKLE